MAIDFNTSPYYDDFSPSDNFYRILFKPGRAVQARELTQLQSILQNQIEQMGKNVFKDGSIIVGGKSFLSSGSFIKVQETTDISGFEDKTVIGATSGAKAIVRKITPVQTIGVTTYDAALHVVYISGTFVQGETITIDGTATSVTALAGATLYTGQTFFYSIDESVFFVKGHFVFCAPQTVVVSPTFVYQPSARIGLEISEGIKTSEDDVSLLDPAVGTNNYSAPGADRYYIDLTLTTIEYDATVEDSDTTVVEEFIEICNVRRGEIASINSITQFNEIENALARRTYDESGDYTVRPFIAKVKDHLFGNAQLMSVEVSPGKAYVRGFEFETVAPSYITMERARDVETENGYTVALDYGSYIPVSNVFGFFNFTNAQSVVLNRTTANLANAATSAAYFANAVGNARVRYLEYNNTDTYNAYLFDIKLNSGETLSNVRSLTVANIASTTVISSANVYGNTVITYGTDDTFLFKVPQENIKTYANVGGIGSGVTDTVYQAARNFSSVNFAPGSGAYSGNSVATISVTGNDDFVGSGILSNDSIRDRFYAVVTAVSGGAAYPTVGQVIDFTGSNGEIEISGQNALLRVLSGNTFSANVVAVVSSAQADSKVKTLATANVVWTAANGNAYINLFRSDIYDVVSIQDANGNGFIKSYVLDSGQRDDYYDHGNLILSLNASGPILNANTNPNVTVQFRYFEHTGTGYFDADSYTKGGLDWGSIPSYKPTRGDPVRLSDVVDFRPVRAPNSEDFLAGRSPKSGSSFTADFEYYLPRRDKLVLTKERRLTVAKGVPSESPSLPADLPDSMSLYTLDIPPYTGSVDDVKLTYVDNKRYTMRDIGKIDKRVGRLEYYSALSLLEKVAADERIPSAIPGIDRFKNGILVDSFAGHSVADVNNGDVKCSIDFENRTMRPRFVSESYLYSVNSAESSSYNQSFDVLTMDFDEEPFVTQTKATNSVFLTPFEVFTWNGTMTLTPSTDIWADTVTNPTVTVNLNGENDAFTQITLDDTGLTPWGTRWNDWQSVFRGLTDVNVDVSSVTSVDNKVAIDKAGKISVTPTARTDTTTSVTKTFGESFARTGLQFNSKAKTITATLGEKVLDSSIIPFIRSRTIAFTAKNLKPDTELVATFDGFDVTRYCTPAVYVKLEGTIAGNLTSLSVGTRSQGAVLLQKGNVLYLNANVQLSLPEVGNVATLTSAVSTTTANVIDVETFTLLTTNSSGDIAGTFKIPNDDDLKFNLGERAFRLADNLDKRFITTVAETKYLAYGLSQTKEDTILATRMNLVSINPLLAVRKGDTVTSTTTNTNRGVSTTGTTNEVNLPPPVLENTQTLFCGERVKTNGQNGVHHFKINLGSSPGPANIICRTGVIPDQFTAVYNGQEITSGFITTTNDAGTISAYNTRLKDLGYPEITRPNTNNFKLEFLKQEAGVEFATLKVDAPLQGTGWEFEVQCPSGTTNPAPGTLSLSVSDTVLALTNRDTGRNGWTDTLTTQTGVTDVGIRCTITNTATNRRWSKAGTDKSVYITNISVDTSGMTLNAGSGYSIGTTGTGQGVYGGTIYPNKTSTPFSNTLGALPVLLQAGESRTFELRVQKPGVATRLQGTLKLNVTAVGPGTGGTQPVSVNVPEIRITTTEPPSQVYEDPLAQTFFVNERDFPSGLFISSVDLWFLSKDNVLPVSVEMRPVVNGYPSSNQLIPFAYKVVDSSDIVASTTFDPAKYTRFSFPAPVYLPPGQYCMVVRGNSKSYRMYSAILGEFELNNTDRRVTNQPYLGSLFKSQNASTWTPEQFEDLTFRINKCKFDTANPTTITLNAVAPKNNVEYDVFFTTGETVQFADTGIIYSYKGTSDSTGLPDGAFRRYLLGSNIPLEERKVLKASNGTTLKFNAVLQTTDSSITPVLDLERLSSVLVRNIINNDSTGEDGFSGGNAAAKYITRRVTLAPGFEAQDLKVYLNAYCPGPSSIKVYFKVNAPGTTQFDAENRYVEMTATNVSGDTKVGFAEFTLENATDTCLPDGARFNTFTIKVVMLSSDTTQVPIIRDLRVLALDD